MWDPLSGLLFDYTGGLADLAARRLRALPLGGGGSSGGCPAGALAADPARVLRGVRVAARAGALGCGAAGLAARAPAVSALLRPRCLASAAARCSPAPPPSLPPLSLSPQDLDIEPLTAAAMAAAAPAAAALPPGRLRMELDALLAYGAAAPSLLLLERLGLLAHLLPQHAALVAGGGGGGLEGSPLMAVLRALDARAAPGRRAPPEAVAALLVAPLVHARLLARGRARQPQQQETRQQQQEAAAAQPAPPQLAGQGGGPAPWRRLQGGLLAALQRDAPEAAPAAAAALHTSRPAASASAAAGQAASAPEGQAYSELHGLIWDAAEEVRPNRAGGRRRLQQRWPVSAWRLAHRPDCAALEPTAAPALRAAVGGRARRRQAPAPRGAAAAQALAALPAAGGAAAGGAAAAADGK
jgi:hypothetical protein